MRSVIDSGKAYLQWWKSWGTLPVRQWVRAAALYRRGDYEGASDLYQLGLDKFPDHRAAPYAHLDRAYCLFKLGRLREAEEHLTHIISVSPDLREAYARLLRLQVWSGQTSQAAWTVRRALRRFGWDADLLASLLLCVIENDGPRYLLKEAEDAYRKLADEAKGHHRLKTAIALLAIRKGQVSEGRKDLTRIASRPDAPLEALVAHAEILMNEGRVAYARQILRRAQLAAPKHPRVLSLFAASYLKSGPFYNPEFAVQLATTACQHSEWLSPREMHMLAEAYFQQGDTATALGIAYKAKEAGEGVLGTYRDSADLDRLIESLSSNVRA